MMLIMRHEFENEKKAMRMRLSDHISNYATRIHDIHFIKYHDFF